MVSSDMRWGTGRLGARWRPATKLFSPVPEAGSRLRRAAQPQRPLPVIAECRPRGASSTTCTAYSTADFRAEPAVVPVVDTVKWKQHVLFCAIGLCLASVHRVTLAILAVPFQQEFGLTLPQMGVLQSSMLWGYVLGQIPSGVLADRVGGSPLMAASLLFWCAASALMPLARAVPREAVFPFLLAARVLLGIGQSGIVTSTSAMAARWVPSEHTSKAMGFAYFLFSGGVVLSMVATPLVAQPLGWPAAFQLYSLLGIAWAAWGRGVLAPESQATHARSAPPPPAQRAAARGRAGLPRAAKLQVAVLVWTHSVIGWGFTLLQNWIPTILAGMGMTDLQAVGAVSALPWTAASLVALLGGVLSDWLHNARGWRLPRVRRFCQSLACFGPAAALAYLGLRPCSVPAAVCLLVAAAGLQAFCYAGFHSYCQDVASADAGRLLGLTNTGGTVLGVACNVLTGHMAASPAGFSAVFCVAAAVYLSSGVTWLLFMRGQQLSLTGASTDAA